MQEQQVAPDRILGLDVGGAGLKAADSAGRSARRRFALWRNPAGLAAELAALAQPWQPGIVALAMTGELCDCFRTKAEGVNRILDAAAAAFPAARLLVWTMPGGFAPLAAAREAPWSAAASNWHALAVWAGRVAGPEPTLLIDMGSTTTDLIPLVGGVPQCAGFSDPERLRDGTLLYQGTERTPLCALRQSVAFSRGTFGVANEFFATIRDARLLLGELPQDPDDAETADGRPATREFAAERLARMIAADAAWLGADELVELARQFAAAQNKALRDAIARLAAKTPFHRVLLAGQGEAVVRSILPQTPLAAAEIASLADRLGPELSRVAPAYALAILAAEKVLRR